jgi:tetratricopeptide (TPR) repeat protein
MSFDPYMPCPCGSGKKFKWCCQPIYTQIDKAFRQDAEGQHDAALRIMDELTAEHSANPEAWGRKAQLYYHNGRLEEAEQALAKALQINPQYPFGHFLQGMFREEEGEIAGALILYRKAIEEYDPLAKDVLADVHGRIGSAELKLNRPVAARAAFAQSLHLRPEAEMRQMFDAVFGDQSNLPAVARREHGFLSPPTDADPAVRTAWDAALNGAASGKIADAVKAFEQLTTQQPDDGPAWYNLAMGRAWLGNNKAALAALDRYVQLEPDEESAAAAWALAEVLRFGHGMEDEADYVEHSAVFQIRDGQRFVEFLNGLQKDGLILNVQVHREQNTITGIFADRSGLIAAGEQPAFLKIGAYLLVLGDIFRLSGGNRALLDKCIQTVQEQAGGALSESRVLRGPAQFGDVFSEAVLIPTRQMDDETLKKHVRENLQRYFEETWMHRPLKALAGVTPMDAAGHGVLRKKLRGLLQFLADSSAKLPEPIDFDRLRRKLGIEGGAASGVQAPQPSSTNGEIDIEGMGAAELAKLTPNDLSNDQIDRAFQTAKRLDAQELAGRFAQAFVERPVDQAKPDRLAWYAFLVSQALGQGDTEAALGYVDEGEKADCEQNEGRRRNDYELRRGQVLGKRGDSTAAKEVFQRLIDRVPGELRYRGTAAETMLTMKQPVEALRFAEQGLAKAREKNDRDSEQYFMELVAAAKKQAG